MAAKEDSKSKDATVSVNVEDFTKTRDSVLYSLAQLQTAVSELSRAYIHHTNIVLNRDQSGLDLSSLTSGVATALQEHGLLGRPGFEAGDKRKRKRAPPDPNAPKRALTPFFLFMQHNRSKIADELGPQARPKEVADEGTKRWGTLPESQKEIWRKLYADNLANYREKMKAYKAGLPVPDDDNAKAANQLQQDAAGVEGSASESEGESSESESEEESSPEPVKEPTPPRSGKRRPREGKTAKEPAPAPTPVKKDKRSAGRKEEKKEEDVASARKSDPKRQKKKRKSEVGSEE